MTSRLAFLIVLAASPAFPQGFEAAVQGGYTTPGAIDSSAAEVTDLELSGSFTWGASLGYFFSPRLGLEASWARQESALEIATGAGRAEMFDVNVDQVQGSFVFRLGGEESRVRPFLTAGMGAAFFSASALDTETKLSFGLGAGARWQSTPRVGARLQARYVPTYLNDAASEFCDPFGFCQGWLHQLELTGALVVRF